MRSILTLSLPPDLFAGLKKKAKAAKMSVSAYVRRLVENEERLISEDELLARCKEAEKNYREGKVYRLGPKDRIEDLL